MGKTWVLHTETKGTGANMVPLERTRNRSSASEPMFVPREPPPRQAEAPKPKTPNRFRIVDVLTRLPLVEDGSAREAADALKNVRSIVDVNVFVWYEERQDWRLLTLGEQRAMMDLAVGA